MRPRVTGTGAMNIHPGFVGCDVSKLYLDIFDARTGVSERIPNAAPELAALAERIARNGDLLIFEATGRYDKALRQALAARGCRFARVNPARARAFRDRVTASISIRMR